MDQHPIPRQITTFEFKLIGFMTLKQFIYLAMAFPIAYIVFALFPIPVLNFLLAAIVAFAGIAFAFIRIMDRPLDVWIKNLYKRLQSPTQYFYQKKNEPLYFLKDLYFLADPHHMLAHIESKEKLAQYLAATRQRQRPDYRKKQIGTLIQTPTDALQKQPLLGAAPVAVQATTAVSASATVAPMPATVAGGIPTVPAAPVAQVVVPPDATHAAVIQVPHAPDFSKETVTTDSDSTQTDTPASASTVQSTESVPAHQAPAAPVATQAWRMIAEPAAPAVSTVATPAVPQYQTAGDVVSAMPPRQPLMQTQVIAPKPAPPVPVVEPPTQPFLTGIVKTGKRIPLPGVMIYMKDQSGNPVRLMKSNPHGVFASYNPVPPGSYVLEIKDPNGMYFFDTMNISVRETNPLPVEIMSKEIL
jgi:hypothetical protein